MTGELLKNYEAQINTLALVPSGGGRFEVSVDDELIYSKLATGRHANPGEVAALFKNYIKENG